jgi:uncharacterized FlaG/YvyC family protein
MRTAKEGKTMKSMDAVTKFQDSTIKSNPPSITPHTKGVGSEETRPGSIAFQEPLSLVTVHQITKGIETFLESHNVGLKFQVQTDTGEIVIKVFDKEKGRLIREISSANIRYVAEQIKERFTGLIFSVS